MDEWSIPKHVRSTFLVFYQPCLINLPSHRNIRCIMAYIVDLTVILYRLFESRHSVSAANVQSAVSNYAKSITRDRIHEDIRNFVTQIPYTYQNRDTFMEKVIDLIKQNCVRTASQDSG